MATKKKEPCLQKKELRDLHKGLGKALSVEKEIELEVSRVPGQRMQVPSLHAPFIV